MVKKILVLGGARSGKSTRAEEIADSWPTEPKIYIATYQMSLCSDDEMAERVQRHQDRRGSQWQTIEAGLNLPQILRDNSKPNAFVLLDCATMWLASLLEENEESIRKHCDELAKSLQGFEGHLIVVANEVGMSLVPELKINRLFRDMNGYLNQKIAKEMQKVEWVVAGIATVLKGDK